MCQDIVCFDPSRGADASVIIVATEAMAPFPVRGDTIIPGMRNRVGGYVRSRLAGTASSVRAADG